MKESFGQIEKNREKNLSPETILNVDKNIRPEFQNEITTETYSFFRDMLIGNGYTEFSDINAAYHTLPTNPMIVRREDPRNVLKLFSEGGSYTVGFIGDERYSNCVEWNPHTDGPRNLSNAYSEGFTNLNNVVTVIGMKKNQDDDLERLPDATPDFYGLDRAGVRSFQGAVAENKITFINLRVPGHLLPETELTESEIDKVDEYLELTKAGKKAQPVMVHRSYIKKVTTEEQNIEQKEEAA
jgi:hypothetical protein